MPRPRHHRPWTSMTMPVRMVAGRRMSAHHRCWLSVCSKPYRHPPTASPSFPSTAPRRSLQMKKNVIRTHNIRFSKPRFSRRLTSRRWTLSELRHCWPLVVACKSHQLMHFLYVKLRTQLQLFKGRERGRNWHSRVLNDAST